MGRSGQNVYIHESCVSDGTLENVIGELIGNSRQGTSDDSVPGLAIPGSVTETNTTSEWNLTATQNECQSKLLHYHCVYKQPCIYGIFACNYASEPVIMTHKYL